MSEDILKLHSLIEKYSVEFIEQNFGYPKQVINYHLKKFFSHLCYSDGAKKRIELIKYRGGRCVECGESRLCTLDLHHTHDKLYGLDSKSLRKLSYEEAKLESEKCIVLCSNCHRVYHYNKSRKI